MPAFRSSRREPRVTKEMGLCSAPAELEMCNGGRARARARHTGQFAARRSGTEFGSCGIQGPNTGRRQFRTFSCGTRRDIRTVRPTARRSSAYGRAGPGPRLPATRGNSHLDSWSSTCRRVIMLPSSDGTARTSIGQWLPSRWPERFPSRSTRTRWRRRWPMSWSIPRHGLRLPAIRSRSTRSSRSRIGCPGSNGSSTRMRAACGNTTAPA